MNINWYPGHMNKAKKELQSLNKFVDLYLILLDARAPLSTRNTELEQIIKDKPRAFLLNKSELADPELTKKWIAYFNKMNERCMEVDCLTKRNINKIDILVNDIVDDLKKKSSEKGRRKIIRFAVIGVPNVGKSSLINQLSNTSKAKTGDKPGVTRAKQWIKINEYFEMLDTPGLLVPKMDDKDVAYKLCALASIKEELYNPEEIATYLIDILKFRYNNLLMQKYKLDFGKMNNEEYLNNIGIKRGCIIRNGEIDKLKASKVVLDDFRKGRIGRITLDEI